MLRSTRRARHRRPFGHGDLLSMLWPFSGGRARSARHAASRRIRRDQVPTPAAAVEDAAVVPRLAVVPPAEEPAGLRAA